MTKAEVFLLTCTIIVWNVWVLIQLCRRQRP
jgi:hypothetical protein